MSRSNLAEFFETECVPRLTASAVYREARLDRRTRHYLQSPCPFAAGKNNPGAFVVDARTLRWSCLDHCHRGGQSVLAYLNGGLFPRPGTGELEAAFDKAARLAEIPRKNLPAITPEAHQELFLRDRVAGVLETFFLRARELLSSSPPAVRQRIEDFFARHGFTVDEFDDLPFGLVGDIPSIRLVLEQAGYTAQEIDASLLTADRRLAGRVVGPIRDRYGRILSFWARDPAQRPPKFLFKGPWKDQTALVGLDAAFGAADQGRGQVDDLLVVERLFDTLVLHELGFASAAAVAGPASDLTKSRWERLAALGVRRVTLAPDRADVSRQAALAALQNAFEAESAPEVWVLLPESLGEHSSAVEFARVRGLAEFHSLLATQVVHAYHFKAFAILSKHLPSSGWSDPARHAAWKEAIEFYARSDPKNLAALDSHFVPPIVRGLERSWDTFEPIFGPAIVERRMERLPPRPAIPRPSAAPCPAENLVCAADPSPHATPSNGKHPALGRRAGRNGVNGFCRLHHCDTTSCFCFD